MFTRDDLRELAAYQTETPILSVYLNVDPTERTTDEYKLALRQMLKKQAEGLAAPEDIEAVERFINHKYDWSGRGVVIFSGAREGFWRTYSLAVPVTSGVTVARKPYIWPMAALMDAYGSYAVALVDRQEVRLLFFDMGELQISDGYTGEDIRKLKKGRGSSGGPGRRGVLPCQADVRRKWPNAIFGMRPKQRCDFVASTTPNVCLSPERIRRWRSSARNYQNRCSEKSSALSAPI